jgi:hypothetical protein
VFDASSLLAHAKRVLCLAGGGSLKGTLHIPNVKVALDIPM